MPMSLDEFRQAVDRISVEEPELRNSLIFYADMLTTLYQLSDEVTPVLEEKRDLYAQLAKTVVERGTPLLELVGELGVPEDTWLRILERVASKVREHRPELSSDLDSLMNAARKGSFSPSDLAKYSLKGDLNYARGVAAGLNVDLDLVNAIALWTIQPILIALRRMVEEEIDSKNWLRGYCPVCGSYTRTAYMTGEGRKQYLKCEICGMEWPFPRLKCPFCGNEDDKKLGFYPVDEGRFRLYVCEECGEYWKVVDEETAGKVIPRELYPVWTFKLDEIASQLKDQEGGEQEGSGEDGSQDGSGK